MEGRLRSLAAPVALAVTLLGACGGTVLGPDDLREWTEAHARWERRPFGDYQFEILISCFCAPEVGQWTLVGVVDGQVIAARQVETGADHPPATVQYWPSIEELFQSIVREDQGQGLRRITVRYDRELGFPTRLDFSYDPGIMDAGAFYQVRNVREWHGCGLGPPSGAQPASFRLVRCSDRMGRDQALGSFRG